MSRLGDVLDLKRRRQGERDEQNLRKLHAACLVHLPPEWHGKRYTRKVALKTDTEREDAEVPTRARWAREVAGLLVEGGLPFAHTLGQSAPDSTVALRCCRGLRAKTLEQMVSCWRPFRRWLLATGRPPFP